MQPHFLDKHWPVKLGSVWCTVVQLLNANASLKAFEADSFHWVTVRDLSLASKLSLFCENLSALKVT